MQYLANPTASTAVHQAMADRHLGLIDTPYQGSRTIVRELRAKGVEWCADNGAFTAKWTSEHWWAWLNHPDQLEHVATCLFATAPDVVGDALATEGRARPWLRRIRDLGYPVAFVAQNGMERTTWDLWDEVDGLFLGGSLECPGCLYVWPAGQKPLRRQPCPRCERLMVEWKLGEEAANLAAVAGSLGKWVHMGRVSSLKRCEYARHIGCDSVDGTFLTYGPDKLLPELLGWVAPGLF